MREGLMMERENWMWKSCGCGWRRCSLEWGWKGRVSFRGRIKCEGEERVKSESHSHFLNFRASKPVHTHTHTHKHRHTHTEVPCFLSASLLSIRIRTEAAALVIYKDCHRFLLTQADRNAFSLPPSFSSEIGQCFFNSLSIHLDSTASPGCSVAQILDAQVAQSR